MLGLEAHYISVAVRDVSTVSLLGETGPSRDRSEASMID